MSTTTIRDTVDSLKESARDAYQDMKSAAHDHIIDPLADTGHRMASAARHGAENAADCGRRSIERTESWITSNPFSAAGIAFGTGVLAGVFLLSRCRR